MSILALFLISLGEQAWGPALETRLGDQAQDQARALGSGTRLGPESEVGQRDGSCLVDYSGSLPRWIYVHTHAVNLHAYSGILFQLADALL